MLIRLFVVTLLIVLSAVSNAQTPQNTDSEVAKTDAEQKAEAERRIKQQEELEKKLKEQASKTKDDGGVFKPTEEISEDTPAPFPVDI